MGRPVGMGAFKRLSDPAHAEIKSMHVLAELRGQGLAKAMVDIWSQPPAPTASAACRWKPARRKASAPHGLLYERLGFTECPPFEGYALDPWSVFLTREI